MLYQDFDLLIDRSGDSLRAQVLNSPAGQASAEFCLPFSEDKLENYLLRLGRTHGVATRRVESQEMNTAKAFGAALFDAVFTGDVKACFRSSLDEVRRQNAGLRIRLRLADPSVADLPWEFLYNRSVNRFIALSVHTPLVRYMDLPERIQPIAVKPPIRVLVMISSPSDYPGLDVEAEWTLLNDSLADRIAAGQIAIERLAGASLESLQHRLRRQSYHIFHFIGHGEFDQALQEGVLILESENKRGHKVDSQFLGMLLHDHESLRVAILNACEGARTSRTDPFAGSAQSLVQQGIPAVIAMQFEIANDVAGRFAHEFYGALADGYPIDASLTEARKSIFAAGREVEWGTPVLYLRAPDGRIFDIDSSAPPARAAAPNIPKVAAGPGRADHDGFAHVVVAAAQAAFAGGQRVEAIEMLRRYDPSSHEGIGEALRELTLEHERLTAEAERVTSERLAEHLRVAGELLANGKASDAWARACDALQLDSTDQRAVALEARVRKALEAQAARDFAREQESARVAREARAREIERGSALTRARVDIENAMTSGDLDRAEQELRRADESVEPGAEFADLRARLLELRRKAAERQEAERQEAKRQKAKRQEAKRQEAKRQEAERQEAERQEAERQEAERQEAERQEAKRQEAERQEAERQEAERQEAERQEAERQEAERQEAERREAERREAERREAERREAAARRDRLAEQVIDQARPHEPASAPNAPEPVASSIMGQPRVLWAAAAVSVIAAAALWLALNRSTQSPPNAAPAPAPEVTAQKQPNTTAPVSAAPPATPASSAPVPPETATVPPGPAAAESDPPPAPGPAADPTATTGTVSPTPAAVPNETTVANFRNHVQTLLAKKDAEQALSVLTEALAYAPADKGLRALSPKVLDQARARASEERSNALAKRASGRTKFKQAERTMASAQTLARERKTEASARAYFDAADMFASAAAGAAAGGASRGEVDAPVTEAAPVTEPEPPPSAPPVKSDPPPVRPKPSGSAEPLAQAYIEAISRGDRAALLAVYPTAPADLLASLSKRRPGYTMRIINTLSIRDSRGNPELVLTVETVAPAGAAEGKPERVVLNFEPAGDTWKVVANR